jgi:hypothetical protein
MRPLLVGQQNNGVLRSSSDEARVNALSNNTVAHRRSSSARMNGDRLPRDSAHPSNVLPSSAARCSDSMKMSETIKLTDSEHWSSKQPSGDVLQSNGVPRSKSERPSAPTRHYVPEPISRPLLDTNSCGKSG